MARMCAHAEGSISRALRGLFLTLPLGGFTRYVKGVHSPLLISSTLIVTIRVRLLLYTVCILYCLSYVRQDRLLDRDCLSFVGQDSCLDHD